MQFWCPNRVKHELAVIFFYLVSYRFSKIFEIWTVRSSSYLESFFAPLFDRFSDAFWAPLWLHFATFLEAQLGHFRDCF